MKKLNDILFSMITTVILLLIFGVSIAYATFAENSHGTAYAHEIIYSAKWFEILLALLIVNLIGSVIYNKITNKTKFSVLLFHLSFIVILIGSGITRYFGSEGIMHLRQGETSNEITSGKSSVRITAELDGKTIEKTTEFRFSQTESKDFSRTIKIDNKTISVRDMFVMPNAMETIEEDPNGSGAFHLFVINKNNQQEEIMLTAGENMESNGLLFAFGESTSNADFVFAMEGDKLFMKAKKPVSLMSMMENNETILVPGAFIPILPRTIYKTESVVLVLKKYLQHAKKTLIQVNPEPNAIGMMAGNGKMAIVFNVSDGNKSKQTHVMMPKNGDIETGTCIIEDMKVSISYGNLPQKLPFSITLNKFQLDRYPGSNSPSSYASEITLNDPEMNVVKPYRIFMNNILNYRGYRFFQSSYDSDEKGTILSVNQDYWGTLVTYTGYFFMLIGMVLTLFNKNSRFQAVIRLSKNLENKQKAAKSLMMIILVGFSVNLMATDKISNKNDHFESLNSLLIHDKALGRIEPISTYASDIIRKIYKKERYNDQTALEVFMSMTVNPALWLNEPVIKVAHKGLAKELGAVKNYVSFAQLIDLKQSRTYKLADKVNDIYQKNPSMRNQYEKELIYVDERLNILNSVFNRTLLNLFPNKTPFTQKLLNTYFLAIRDGYQSGNWNNADIALENVKEYQRQNFGSQLPSPTTIKMEVLYNKLSIFLTLGLLYGLIGVILISITLLNILKYNLKLEKWLDRSIYPLALLFAFFTAGLALRWYISGHAPLSNGYESMIFVAWATALTGLVFANRSPVTLAISSLLTAIALSVAGMSWMNPEITNLVPVLKSYWLVVHVAVIISSYGFFAMAALMALFNLCLMIARTNKNVVRLNENIQKFSYIIELSLIVGLFLLTIGTFIGGVWANESWGRYWGWDAKETWALVSILIYSVILHLRKIPALNNLLIFNTVSIIGFGTVIMTYLGVNYYLSGMHSYGQGTPDPIPSGIYIILFLIVSIIVIAFFTDKKLMKSIDD